MSATLPCVFSCVRRLAFFLVVASCHREPPPPSVHREPAPVIEASAPIASASVSASAAAMEAPALPVACRREIARGGSFAHVRDADITALLVDGKPGATRAHDCRGDAVEYTTPTAPKVIRGDARDDRLAVFVQLAHDPGFWDRCPGFVAVLRVTSDAIVAEGVGAETLQECDDTQMHPRLAKLDGTYALLFAANTGTGENGDASGVWRVSIPNAGALREVGSVVRFVSAGNGTILGGNWLGEVNATILAGDGLRVEEKWDFVRYGDAGEEHGKKLTRVRTYTLEAGALVASPKSDPTQ